MLLYSVNEFVQTSTQAGLWSCSMARPVSRQSRISVMELEAGKPAHLAY